MVCEVREVWCEGRCGVRVGVVCEGRCGVRGSVTSVHVRRGVCDHWCG